MSAHWIDEIPKVEEKKGNQIRRLKLIAPSFATRSIRRSNLTSELERFPHAKLILLRAPAGFGKTMTMGQYYEELQQTDRGTAWLTLDSSDDDFYRFLHHFVAALDAILNPDISNAQLMNDIPVMDIDQLTLRLLDKISDSDIPFTLFIDEFETASNSSINGFLNLVIRSLPDGAQLVIASRTTPELQLSRLRSQGLLIELEQDQLKFSQKETRLFIDTQDALNLSGENIFSLHEKTEGWPVAIRLAANAMENVKNPEDFIATFSGSFSIIAQYLLENLLLNQSDSVQNLLLKTSIVREFNVSLCEQLCGDSDSSDILTILEALNLCSKKDDEREGETYRYHNLFGVFLQAELEKRCPNELSQLHFSAAKWYEYRQRWVPAIDHALSSGKTDYALSLIESKANGLLFDGRFRILARWLDQVPTSAIESNLKLRIIHVCALMFSGRANEALALSNQLETDKALFPGVVDLDKEVLLLKTYILSSLDRNEEAYRFCEEAVENYTPENDFAWFVLKMNLATLRVAVNRYEDALSVLYEPCDFDFAAGRTEPTVYSTSLEGYVSIVQGRTKEGIAQLRQALRVAETHFGDRSFGRSIAGVFLAEALYDIGALEEAEHLLMLYLPTVKDHLLPDLVIIGCVTMARIAHHRGDVDACYQTLSELEYIGCRFNIRRARMAASLEKARVSLIRGNDSAAQSLYAQAKASSQVKSDSETTESRSMILSANDVETIELCNYRLAIRGVVNSELVDEMKDEIRKAKSMFRNRRALKLRILLAKTLHASGHPRRALRMIEECATEAFEEGLMSTFLDEGALITSLLRELRIAKTTNGDSDTPLLQFIDKILDRAGCLPETVEQDSVVEAELSDREIAILESVLEGLSNKAIAERHFVSESTVRSHLRKVNNKLGTKSRTQAVNMAGRLGLM